MVEISLNGSTPSNTSGSPGRGSFDAAKNANKRFTDYGAAEASRIAREKSENKAYDQLASQEAKLRNDLNRVLSAEIKQRETQLRAEARIQQSYSQLQARARDPLTPSRFQVMQRATSQLEFRNQMHRQQYGSSALPASATSNLRQSLGTEGSAFRVGNILRLGNMGQRSADERSYKELARVQNELRRIEKVTEQQYKLAKDPQQQAAIQRQKDAILTARGRIESGKEGTSATRMAAGVAAGEMSLALGNPYVKMAAAAVMAVAGGPALLNKGFASLVGEQAPYQNFRIGISDIARSGGYGTDELQNRVLRNGVAGTLKTGNGLADEMDALGISPSRFQRSLSSYGINTQSATQAVHVATGVRNAYLSPHMGLDEDTLSKLLGLGRSTGAINGGSLFDSDMQKYFNKLQQVMAMSTTQGIDRSRLTQTFSSLISGPGLTTNVPGMASFQANMMSSGSPGARSGADVTSLMQDMSRSATSLGTSQNITGNIVYSSFFARHGGVPTSAKALQKSLGMSDEDFQQMTSTDPAKRALAGFLSAAKMGDGGGMYQYLGQLVQNQPDVQQRVLEGSTYGSMLSNPNLGPRITQSFFGTTLGKSLEYGNGGSSGSQLPGVATMPDATTNGMIAAAAAKYNVPYAAAAAVFRKESNFQNIKSSDPNSSAKGYGQVTDATARAMGYDPSQMLDPGSNIDASMKYYSEQLKATGGNTAAAYERYHYGPGGGSDANDAAKFSSFEGQYNNQPLTELRRQGSGEAASLEASKYMTDSVDVAVKGMEYLATTARAAGDALARIGAMTHLPGYGAGSAGLGMDMGSSLGPPSVPHDQGANGSVPVQ